MTHLHDSESAKPSAGHTGLCRQLSQPILRSESSTGNEASQTPKKRRRINTASPRSYIPFIRRVIDSKDYASSFQAIQHLARLWLWRGQLPENIYSDMMQLAPASFRDLVGPLVNDCALERDR